jgi:hypothetical protein
MGLRLPRAVGYPSALIPGGHGRALLLTRTAHGFLIHRIQDGSAMTIFAAKRARLFGSVRFGSDGIEFLMSDGDGLRLIDLRADGRVTTAWSTPTRARDAAFADGPGGPAIAWFERKGDLRLFTSEGTRTIAGVAPENVDEAYLEDMAIDRDGRTIVALADYEYEVAATIEAGGRVVDRRETRARATVSSLAASDAGRVALLIDDTGDEVLYDHECVNGGGRRIRVALRERETTEIGKTRTLDEPPWACFQADASLLTGHGDRFAVLWGTGTQFEPPAPPGIRVARAAAGEPFGPVLTPWDGRDLRGAVLDSHGTLVVIAVRASDPTAEIVQGPLVVEELDASGAVAPEHVLSASAEDPILAFGAGEAVAVWRDHAGRWRISRGR